MSARRHAAYHGDYSSDRRAVRAVHDSAYKLVKRKRHGNSAAQHHYRKRFRRCFCYGFHYERVNAFFVIGYQKYIYIAEFFRRGKRIFYRILVAVVEETRIAEQNGRFFDGQHSVVFEQYRRIVYEIGKRRVIEFVVLPLAQCFRRLYGKCKRAFYATVYSVFRYSPVGHGARDLFFCTFVRAELISAVAHNAVYAAHRAELSNEHGVVRKILYVLIGYRTRRTNVFAVEISPVQLQSRGILARRFERIQIQFVERAAVYSSVYEPSLTECVRKQTPQFAARCVPL